MKYYRCFILFGYLNILSLVNIFRREDKTDAQGRFADLCKSTYKRKVSRHDVGANRGDLGTQHEKKTVIKETSWQ